MDFLFFHEKTCFSFTKSIKLQKQLGKRYDTNKAILETFLSLAGVVQYAVYHPFEAFKTLILSGMLSVWVLQNLGIFSL